MILREVYCRAYIRYRCKERKCWGDLRIQIPQLFLIRIYEVEVWKIQCYIGVRNGWDEDLSVAIIAPD